MRPIRADHAGGNGRTILPKQIVARLASTMECFLFAVAQPREIRASFWPVSEMPRSIGRIHTQLAGKEFMNKATGMLPAVSLRATRTTGLA
jgi:hypothetical protein